MEEKEKSRGLFWLIIILIVLVLGLVGYIVYDKVLVDNNSVNNNKENNTSDKSTTTEKIETITNEELEKYLSYVPFSLLHEDAYHGNNFNISNVNKASLLFTVFHHPELKYATYEDGENCWGGSCILEEEFNKKLVEMYNVQIEMFNSEYNESEKWVNLESYLLLKDGHYFELGYGGGKYKSDISNISYEIINNELIIKEQIGIIVESVGDVIIFNGGESIKEYTYTGVEDSDAANFEEQAEKYIKDNINDFNTYKHIFKKNNNGTYYWYSTEVVN